MLLFLRASDSKRQQSLGEATRIHKGVRDNLKLHQQVRQLRDELRKAYSELNRYRQTHARAVTNLRQFERETTAQTSTLRRRNPGRFTVCVVTN
ncbi:hypothetical protein D3879_23820 [Pseudomonas cavernicola]|uniref:Uncharacterized protein n=1 Tax=Pseudomonas cavernicola TaxID=2320866 RepID=A0A418X902_9PSED|nr:hypothetical protein D3879_23820 [Pseudomonas cavernicola]